jgi:Zn-dependent M28 family amino/carboxypeptidase
LVNESERSIPSGTTGLVVKKLSGSFAGKATSVVEKIKVANVVGVLPGSDPVLKSEFIGVGSHLDHLGNVGGTVYYGADDDGSGTTAVLMVAKGLAANKLKPKRSTVFMAFYGEEMGLLGSAYLANNPPFDLSKMVAELQLDMVGRDSDGAQNGDMNRIDKASENTDTIRLVGSKRISTTLDTIIQEQNKFIGFRFKYDAEDVYTRSDHYNFAAKGIPIAFFFSGFHPDYHQPTDTVEKINYDKITNTAKLVYLTTHAVAARPGRLPKDVPQG